eukprot:Amastigsp_a343726_17.p3 type:complete len:106 gc:universal Amastigsp_a343726_17:723-406(-)
MATAPVSGVRALVRVFSKTECSLCDDAIEVLEAVRARVPFELEVVDIEEPRNAKFFDMHQFSIPVITCGDVTIACGRRIEPSDGDELEAALRKAIGQAIATGKRA